MFLNLFNQYQIYAKYIRKSLTAYFGIFVVPMKILYTLISLAISMASYAQCKDIYGNITECPNEQDSLVIYNNALKIMFFYDSNKSYKLKSSIELVGIDEKRQVFDRLIDARRMFSVIRRALKGTPPENPKYKDITYAEYYQEIDEYRFYQRELENQIVNAESEFPMYDIRIWPILINEYINEDSSSIYFGDLVQIPLYVPVIVKPFDLLTGPELALRNKLLHIVAKDSSIAIKPAIREMIKRDTSVSITPLTITKVEGTPIYAYNSNGSGCIIGFIQSRTFVKIKPSQYHEFAVMKFAQEILADDKLLSKYLAQKFGKYIDKIL